MFLYEKIAQQKAEQEKIRKMMQPIPEKAPDKRYVALMSSTSHTYGNALTYMQNWIMNLFPENTFSTVHVNSKIAHRQIKSTPHEYLKKSTPMITFRPRIPGRGEDTFLKGTAMTERMTDIYSTYGNGNLCDFIQDPMHDLVVKYQLKRHVMYVDVMLTFSTLVKQLDYYHYIENATRIDHPFNLKTFFESYIPQDMLKIMGDCVGVPLYDNDGTTKTFLDYMNGHSYFPITFKLDGASGNKEFYRYYPVCIDTMITDLDKDDGDTIGQIKSQYQISFSVRMEFYATGFYYIFSDKIYKIGLPAFNNESSNIIPVYTDVLMKEDLRLADGWSLFNRAACRLEYEEDSVNFKSMLNHSILETLKYHLKNGMPLMNFIDIKIRKQGKPIHQYKDYDIDWDKMEIKFKNGEIYFTYSIMVCVNISYINDLMKKIYNLK